MIGDVYQEGTGNALEIPIWNLKLGRPDAIQGRESLRHIPEPELK